MSEYQGLTDEQVEAEREFLKGMPFFNIGALFLPPIWGPAHGMWFMILWYPIWLLADNCFYLAMRNPHTMYVGVAIAVFVILTAVTFLFARLSQPWAAHRAVDDKGKSKETYLKQERIWAVCSVVAGCIMIAGATYYNLVIRPTMG